ncbi:MAG: hypothetical protein EBT99_15320 [Betaproteobacteria bacterium]|nr:hypothetical protein [Betaproteobacteria bacterium]NDC04415.1 hypothetical protein [Betaproteobacteria bacterium]NDC87105.1 hypothetical protein [Betaproteobacteria bacterium]NDG83339.1 hypothetical protein [Betaproteobacteria bacterium]
MSNGCRCRSLLTEQPQLSHCASAIFADFAKISLHLDEAMSVKPLTTIQQLACGAIASLAPTGRFEMIWK